MTVSLNSARQKVFFHLVSNYPNVSEEDFKDAVQAAFERANTNGKLDNIGWLKVTAEHVLIDAIRKENRQTDMEKLPDKPEEEPSVKLPTEIEDYLKKHPDGKLWLMRLEGYTWTEISQRTNLKYATVMQRKNRLERDMRKKFGGTGGKSKGGGGVKASG